jgi:hypothetical protein
VLLHLFQLYNIKVNLWSNEKDTCDKKIWDILWGNIVRLEIFHTGEKVKYEIEKITGAENVEIIVPGLLWFNLSENPDNFNIVKYSKERERLFQYFKSQILLM